MQALTDNALMLKVKSGDMDKMGLLYERHKKRLFGFFYHMNGNASLSEDLVQNVFVRILKYKHTFTGQGSFSAWMFRTARNVNYDHFRKHSKEGRPTEISTLEYRLQDADAGSVMDYDDTVSLVNRALQRLSPEKREVLILSKYKAMKYSEIGSVLGCSEGAAKVKAHRAIKDLRTIFLQMENS
ncbi:RNA polymerase sigma factor [Flavobacteriaceae bacterium 3-367]|uniref:RNA polymerase sigma factor n=1 Tax=Eudoraea algarum TaxID=3417568 RepID=UPI003286405E